MKSADMWKNGVKSGANGVRFSQPPHHLTAGRSWKSDICGTFRCPILIFHFQLALRGPWWQHISFKNQKHLHKIQPAASLAALTGQSFTSVQSSCLQSPGLTILEPWLQPQPVPAMDATFALPPTPQQLGHEPGEKGREREIDEQGWIGKKQKTAWNMVKLLVFIWLGLWEIILPNSEPAILHAGHA